MDTNIKFKNKYDLEERTIIFSESVIELCKRIDKNIITIPIINQLLRCGTSIGANYCEANGASSKKDFKNKIYICKKEAKETRYWLKLLKKSISANNELLNLFDNIFDEAYQLLCIFSKIAFNTKSFSN